MQQNATKRQIATKILQRLPRIVDRLVKGWSIPEIAAKEGVHTTTIYRNLKHLDLGELTNPLYAETLAEIRNVEDPKIRLPMQLRILQMIMPRTVVSRITGEIEQKVEVKIPELGGLDEDAVTAIVENFMEDEARRLRQEQPDTVQSPENSPE